MDAAGLEAAAATAAAFLGTQDDTGLVLGKVIEDFLLATGALSALSLSPLNRLLSLSPNLRRRPATLSALTMVLETRVSSDSTDWGRPGRVDTKYLWSSWRAGLWRPVNRRKAIAAERVFTMAAGLECC